MTGISPNAADLEAAFAIEVFDMLNDDNAASGSAIVDSDISRKKFRKNWARLIQKIYNVDPLLYPKCGGVMREDEYSQLTPYEY